MKRITVLTLALLLTATLAFALSSCGNKTGGDETTANETTACETTSEETTSENAADTETTADAGAGDSSTAGSTKIDSMSCDEILDAVYSGLDDIAPMVGRVEINAENSEYYLGVAELNCESAMASEAMIGSIAHSVCVAKFADGTDIEAMKTQIREGINPNKWICVGVDDDKVIVDSIGNTVILILDQDNGESYHTNFLSLAD